ncbi:MAG: hypothetical protein ACKVPX_17375 [Myxococcaceae bacterium]
MKAILIGCLWLTGTALAAEPYEVTLRKSDDIEIALKEYVDASAPAASGQGKYKVKKQGSAKATAAAATKDSIPVSSVRVAKQLP